MKKYLAILALLSSASAPAFAGIQIKLQEHCKWGNADVQDGDIEFSNLNLDIEAGQHIEHKKCEIVTEFPARHGHKLVISTFKVEAFANIKHQGGAAILTLRHNFKDWGWKQAEARAVRPGVEELVVTQKAVGDSDCHKSVKLKTEILTAARNATVLQDAANQVIAIEYAYHKCH